MALSREERIRRAQRALSSARTSAPTAAPTRSRPQPTYPVPRPEAEPPKTLKQIQDSSWGSRAGRAWRDFEGNRAVTSGAVAIGAGLFVSRRLVTGGKILPYFPPVSKQTGGRPNKATGSTKGIEYVGQSRDYMGQIPTYDALAEARKERMPRAVRKATIGPRRAFRAVDFRGVATGAAQNVVGAAQGVKSRITPKPRLKRTAPVPAGSQATNTRSLRSPAPSYPPDRVGIAQRASESARGRGGRPATFGSVKQSPMRQPGTLNIPRAGTRLTGMVTRSPEIPTLPQQGSPRPAKKRKKVAPKPQPQVAPSDPVKMPRVPSVKSVPKPAAPVARTDRSSIPNLKPEEQPKATYRPVVPRVQSVTDVKVKPPLAPEHARTKPAASSGNRRSAKTPRGRQTTLSGLRDQSHLAVPRNPARPERVVYEFEGGRKPGTVVHRGGRSYAVKYGESTFEFPYSPTAESAKEPRSPSRKEKAKPSKTFRAEAPGEQQWRAVFGLLEKRGGMPNTLTKSEIRSARNVGVSEQAALRQKQRAWQTVDPVERNIGRATGSRPPGPGVKGGVRGVPSKSGRYAVKLAKAAGLMSGAGAALAVAEPLISPDTASAAMKPSVKRKAQKDFLDSMRRRGRAEKVTQKYFGGVFR